MDNVFAHSIFPEFVLILLVAALAGALVTVASKRLAVRGLLMRAPRDRPARLLSILAVVVLAAAWFSVYQHLARSQHLALGTHGYDLGIFDQVIWNTAQGRPFASSLMPFAPNALGNHVSLTLLVFVPLYWLWSDPRTLLIGQTAMLALGVVPVYAWAARKLGPGSGVILAACYFLYPALGFVNLFDFHEIALAVPLLGFALYFMLERRYRAFLVFLVLLLLTKEEMAFVTFAIGLYVMFAQRQRRLGSAIAAVSVAYAAIAILWFMPALQDRASTIYVIRYSYLGDSVGEMVRTIITRPWVLLQQFFTVDKLGFVLRLTVPLALLPFVGWQIGLIALPSFVYLLLSDDPNTVAIIFQYPAILIPPLFFAAVLGTHRLSNRSRHIKAGLLAALLVASAGSYFLHGGGPLSRNYQPWRYDAAGRPERIRELLKQIPPEAPVSAQNNLVPHLSQRERIYLFPRLEDATYVVLDAAGDRFPLAEGASSQMYDRAVTAVTADPHWMPVLRAEELTIFKRGPYTVPNPVHYRLGDDIELVGYDVEQHPDRLHVTLLWRARERLPQDYTVFNHLVRPGDSPPRVWAQKDNQPVSDRLPTTAWEPGRLVLDEYDLPLGPEVAPGDYLLAVGMYVAPDGPRLPVTSAGGELLGDSIPLATVQIRR